MGTSKKVLIALGILSTLLSIGAFVFYSVWYYNSQWGWCLSSTAYTNATCYAKTPPGGYFGSWEFRATVEAFVLFFGFTAVVYVFVRIYERRSKVAAPTLQSKNENQNIAVQYFKDF